MKKHYVGATYELTQENMNNLIKQLEEKGSNITFEFANTYQNEYTIKCHMKAVEANIAIGSALEYIRGRLKYGTKVSKIEKQSLEDLRDILSQEYIEG